jgi:amidase
MKRSLLTVTLAALLLLAACVPSEPPLAIPAPTAEPTSAMPTAAAPAPTPEATPEPMTDAQAAVQTPPAGQTPLPAAINETAWDAVLTRWITSGDAPCDAPGGVLLVDSPAGRYLKAAGVTSMENGRPVQVDDRFEIGSNTKAFTVILALQLQEAGILSLDDPLSKWLPELAARIPNGQKVTLRQMAGNTSGIWDYADPLFQPLIDANDQEGLAQSYTPQALVEYAIANGKPDFAPGEGWHYSSTNFILLGMVVEAATGQSLAELYQERIFDPLEMKSTSYLEGAPKPGSIVDGYYKTPKGELANMTNWNATQGGAAGAIVSTAEDVSRFASGLVGGKLLKDASMQEMFDFRELGYAEGGGIFSGYGLGLISFEAPYQAYGHAGQTPGFQSIWFFAPEANATLVLLTNSGSCRVTLLPSTLAPETLGVNAGAAGAAGSCANDDLPFPRTEPEYNAKRVRDLSPFAGALAGLTKERVAELDALLADATILDMQRAMAGGTLTSEELVTYYLDRIRRYDVDKLNSVMELNPQVLDIARQMDEERAAGKVRGDMHGIPVLLKDNIATGDGMHTSAGAYALKDWQPDRDAFLVQQLRDAGAVILGKANLSEWANWMDPCMPNGFSTLGGQTRNPYGPFETYGSSSGSAVAAAANLAAVTVGTETQGSIILPAQVNSVVGLKTSMGLVSRDYVVPLLEWQDVPGPMGRTVTDVAVLLTALAGVDKNDPVTQDSAALATEGSAQPGVDFTRFLSVEAAKALRLGIIVYSDEDIENILDQFGMKGDPGEGAENLRKIYRANSEMQRQTGKVFTDLGFEVVEVSALALPERVDVSAALPYGFKDAINRFLPKLGAQVKVGSLEEIIALNSEDPANRAPYGQGHLEASQNSPLSAEKYLALKEKNQSTTRDALSKLFAENDIDVLLSDVGQAYAPAGFPAMTVPTGYGGKGQPTGLTMIADYLGEPDLIAVGYALEQTKQARRAPDLDNPSGGTMKTSAQTESAAGKPAYVTALEAAYGAPSQAGFGSAVFFESSPATDDLEQLARDKYKYFVGDLWARWGEAAWMGPWQEVYTRPTGAKADIVSELRGIADPDAQNSVPMILENIDGAEQARAALAAAYDDPAVTELRVFNLGDGAAMSGILVAGRRGATGEAAFLVFLMD